MFYLCYFDIVNLVIYENKMALNIYSERVKFINVMDGSNLMCIKAFERGSTINKM